MPIVCVLAVIFVKTFKIYERFHDLPDVERKKKQTNTDCQTCRQTELHTESDSSSDTCNDPITEYITKEMQASISCSTFDHSRDKFDKNLNSFSCNLDDIISELTELSRTFDSVSHTLNRLLTPDIPDSSTSDIPDIPDSVSSLTDTLVSTSDTPTKSASIPTSNISEVLSRKAPLTKPDRFLRYSISSTSHEEFPTFSAFNLFKSDILKMPEQCDIRDTDLMSDYYHSDTINSCISELNSYPAVSLNTFSPPFLAITLYRYTVFNY